MLRCTQLRCNSTKQSHPGRHELSHLLCIVFGLAALSLSIVSGDALADSDNSPIKVSTYMDFPPFITDSEPDGGIISAIVKESFAAASIEIETPLIPWRRAHRAVQRGEILASYSWAYSEQRAENFHLSTPIFAISNQIITTYSDISDWQQLKKPRVDGNLPILCIPIGWKISHEITDLIDNKLLQQVSPGHPRFCLDLVRANRTNLLYMPQMTAAYHIAALTAEDSDPGVRPWPDLYSLNIPSGEATTQHIIFTRSPQGLAYKGKFDAGFNALLESGRYGEILAEHLDRYSQIDRETVYRDQKNAGILP